MLPQQEMSPDMGNIIPMLPSVCVAATMVLFLMTSFITYHCRHVKRRRAAFDYVTEHSDLMRVGTLHMLKLNISRHWCDPKDVNVDVDAEYTDKRACVDRSSEFTGADGGHDADRKGACAVAGDGNYSDGFGLLTRNNCDNSSNEDSIETLTKNGSDRSSDPLLHNRGLHEDTTVTADIHARHLCAPRAPVQPLSMTNSDTAPDEDRPLSTDSASPHDEHRAVKSPHTSSSTRTSQRTEDNVLTSQYSPLCIACLVTQAKLRPVSICSSCAALQQEEASRVVRFLQTVEADRSSQFQSQLPDSSHVQPLCCQGASQTEGGLMSRLLTRGNPALYTSAAERQSTCRPKGDFVYSGMAAGTSQASYSKSHDGWSAPVTLPASQRDLECVNSPSSDLSASYDSQDSSRNKSTATRIAPKDKENINTMSPAFLNRHRFHRTKSDVPEVHLMAWNYPNAQQSPCDKAHCLDPSVSESGCGAFPLSTYNPHKTAVLSDDVSSTVATSDASALVDRPGADMGKTKPSLLPFQPSWNNSASQEGSCVAKASTFVVHSTCADSRGQDRYPSPPDIDKAAGGYTEHDKSCLGVNHETCTTSF